jgi:hypothetical protein
LRFCWCFAQRRFFATAKWADEALPVHEGLQLWLDVSRMAAANKAHDSAPPVQRGVVETWFDGSGQHRDLAQSEPAARPRWAAATDPKADPSEVRELPLDLPNLNNLRYRADGKFVAVSL